ncbi:hypothetical protein [Dyadobacter sp. CY323]|uniref:hypothetical protein n=1 Tax=Dyadobacter sp. CY323 TaxID=2907302 RepID=UPI001F19DE05|nr:hypothetical protein [Dyadobacter sp. CY323]MCE6987774.1 hypothetical protein [Dyadobacter sp. CY323]
MLVTYGYFGLIAIYASLLLVSIAHYLITESPTGDRSVAWATGIFYLIGLSFVTLLALFLWEDKPTGLAILVTPLLFLAWPVLQSKARHFYIWMPLPGTGNPLTICIINQTDAIVQTQFECWAGKQNGSKFSLLKTLDFFSQPLETSFHKMSAHELGLLAHKSRYVRISSYECVNEEGSDHTYLKRIEPCMQFKIAASKDFLHTEYLVTIHEDDNSDAFRSEVELLKRTNMYSKGTF